MIKSSPAPLTLELPHLDKTLAPTGSNRKEQCLVQEIISLLTPLVSGETKSYQQVNQGNKVNMSRGDSMMPYRAAVSKLKMIRNANLFKEIITQKSQNKFMAYFKSKLSFQISVFFSGISVIALSLTTKRTVCTPSSQRWVALILFWFSNFYFSLEFFSLVN